MISPVPVREDLHPLNNPFQITLKDHEEAEFLTSLFLPSELDIYIKISQALLDRNRRIIAEEKTALSSPPTLFYLNSAVPIQRITTVHTTTRRKPYSRSNSKNGK